MSKRIELSAALAEAGHAMDFSDGDRQRIWNGAASRSRRRRPKLALLIPITAACIVLVSVLSIEPARAAVFDFLGRMFDIMDYMGMDKDRRPENTTVSGLLIDSIQADVTIQEYPDPDGENTWVNSLKPHIDEFLYDGQSICVKYTVEGSGLNGLTNIEPFTEANKTRKSKKLDTMNITLHGGKDAVKTPCTTYCDSNTNYDNGIVQGVARFSGEKNDGYDLNGIIDVELILDCNVLTETQDMNGEIEMDINTVGTITFRFSFDATAGKNSAQNMTLPSDKHYFRGDVIAMEQTLTLDKRTVCYTNRKLSLEGCSLSVASASQTPAETKVVFHFEPSQAVKEFKFENNLRETFLRIELLVGDSVVGTGENFEYSDLPLYNMVISAPLLSQDVKRLKVRVQFFYISELFGQTTEVDKSITHPVDLEGFGPYQFSYMDVEGGEFFIDLP